MSNIKINLLLLHSASAPPYWTKTPLTQTLQEEKAQTVKTQRKATQQTVQACYSIGF
jgi:hypothetical protein